MTGRIVLFCNAGYGVRFERAVRELASERHVSLIVVHSARALRGRRWARRAIERLREWILHVHAPWVREVVVYRFVDDVNAPSFVRQIRDGDVGVIAGFDQIFRAPLIERFASLVNVHPSVLPLYRGPVPSHWCLVNGESMSGYTLHRVTPRIDAGEILFQETVTIAREDDATALDARIAEAGAATMKRFLESMIEGERWAPVRIEARDVYRQHVDYRSFPSRSQTA